MNTAYLLLGGNVGDRKENLEEAKKLLAFYCGKILSASSVYETEAWGKTDQPAFFNQAIKLETTLSAAELLKKNLHIESVMGRQRQEKYGPRIIDIDILFYNEEIHNSINLKIPHPELPNRRFALIPLNEIASAVKHPLLKKTVHELLLDCPDHSAVKKSN